MWQAISLQQGKHSRCGVLLCPLPVRGISGIFFFSFSHGSEFSLWPNFICGKMLSGRACWDFVWACLTEEGQTVCTPKMKKKKNCFCASKITEQTLSKMNECLSAGIMFTSGENEAVNIQYPTSRFQKGSHSLKVSCTFPPPGLSHCFPKCGLRATPIRIKIKESLSLEKDPV